jgi:hypothetical protein
MVVSVKDFPRPTAIEAYMVGSKGTVEPVRAINPLQKLNLSVNNLPDAGSIESERRIVPSIAAHHICS